MSKVVSNAKKSPLPAKAQEMRIGEDIIYELDDTLWRGQCYGWSLVDGVPMIKVHHETQFGWARVPENKVWRVWDGRDIRIKQLENMLCKIDDVIAEFGTEQPEVCSSIIGECFQHWIDYDPECGCFVKQEPESE